MNSNKRIAIALGGVAVLFTLSLLVRFVALNWFGVGGGWMYLGLPFSGIGIVVLLLRLGLVDSGRRSENGFQPGSFIHHIGDAQPTAPTSQIPSAMASQRLQDLESMRVSGAISSVEYAARRQEIIASI